MPSFKRRASIQNWQTPAAVFAWASRHVGGFDLDAAADAENALCARYLTRAEDGLIAAWLGRRVWINPPFADVKAWMRRAFESVFCGEIQLACMLVPAALETDWFRTYAKRASAIYLLHPRIKYVMPKAPRDRHELEIPSELLPRNNDGPPLASCLVFFVAGHLRPADAPDVMLTYLDARALGAANEDQETEAEASTGTG